jgi:hypothetical protein
MGRACSSHLGDKKHTEKPEEERPLGRPRFRWEDNIKTDFEKKC